MTLQLRLFGTFAAVGDSAPGEVRGTIPQAIVARLALQPGRVFSTEELVADLWAEPTESVVSSLRAHISRLRARGWGPWLSGGRAGYRLDLAADAVDIVRYRLLIESAGTDRLADLAEAESLWRGAPLAWAAEFPFAARVVDDLTRLRRAAVVELTTARLEQGDAAAAVAGVSALAADLSDEELGALYARALDASGRTSDALEAVDTRLAVRRDRGEGTSGVLEEARLRIAQQTPQHADAPVAGSAVAARSPIVREVDRIGIPVPATGFIGRGNELDAVARGRAASRLVTLTGPAGVGKTRLAVEVARRAGAEQDETQRLIDLAVVPSPDRVVPAVADSVGASEHSIDGIARVLGGTRTLMILDNAEHVLGSAASLCAGLLERCEGLSVVVTSREAMRMAGERVITVEPLTGAGLTDAVDLFLQRASDSSGIAQWSPAQVDDARRLCARLDGLPLAIELAAARLDVLTLDELLSSIDQSASGAASDGRHDSIDAAIEWSMRTTPDTERAMLSQLVEFSGSFSLEAVAGICVSDLDPREVTVALARRSLVTTIGATAGERRFRVLDTVKRYVKNRHPLADREAWRARHALWMTAYAQRTAPLLRTSDDARARLALAANRADLDDACHRLIERGDRAEALRLVGALGWYWYERGRGLEAVGTIERVIAMPGEDDPAAEAAALHAVAYIHAFSGGAMESLRTMHRLVAATEAANDSARGAIAHSLLAAFAGYSGQPEQFDAEMEIAQKLLPGIDDAQRWAVVDHLSIRGDALRAVGRPAQGLDALEEAYRLATDLGYSGGLASTCYLTAKLLVEVGRARDALGMLRTGGRLSVQREDGARTVVALTGIADALVELGEPERAAELFGAVESAAPRYGVNPVGSDGVLGSPYRRRARTVLGDEAWESALGRGRTRDMRWVVAQFGTGS